MDGRTVWQGRWGPWDNANSGSEERQVGIHTVYMENWEHR